MERRLKKFLIAEGCALIVGPLLFVFLTDAIITKITIASIIMGLVIAIGIFVIIYFLNQKGFKKKMPVYILIGLMSFFAFLSIIIIVITPAFLFYPRFDENSYNKLLLMKDTVSQSPPKEITAANGTIRGWRIPAREVSEGIDRPVILMFMGNGMESSSYCDYVLEHSDIYGRITASNDMVFFDYPEYGQSEGDLTVSGLLKMAMDCFETVNSLPDTRKVIVMGYSLGTGPACYLASETNVDGLILLAPYKDAYDVFNNKLNVFHGPLKLLVTYRMDSMKYAEKVTCPVLIFASDSDSVIPYHSSKSLASGFENDHVDFNTMSGLGHDEFLGHFEVINSVSDFVEDILK